MKAKTEIKIKEIESKLQDNKLNHEEKMKKMDENHDKEMATINETSKNNEKPTK